MIDERTRVALMRTHGNLVRHLEDLNDEIDQCGGRLKNHMVLDGFKDTVKTLCRIEDLLGASEPGEMPANNGVATQKAKAATI